MNNVYDIFSHQVTQHADQLAMIDKDGNRSLSFLDFHRLVLAFEKCLKELGLQTGDIVLMMIKPNFEYNALVFAMMKSGIVPAFVDPGMKREYFLKAVRDLDYKVMLGDMKAYLFYKIFNMQGDFHFYQIRLVKNALKTFQAMKTNDEEILLGADDDQDESDHYDFSKTLCALLYTSGATGPAKAVEYTHDIFIAQIHYLKEMFDLGIGDVDLAGFPLFSMFTMSMGVTSVIADIDVSKPSQASGEKLFNQIIRHHVTFCSGSPAIWKNLAHYALASQKTIPFVKSLVTFGAPIQENFHHMFSKILEVGDTYAPYGATESLPISVMGYHELRDIFQKQAHHLKHPFLGNQYQGICVGKPVMHVQIFDHQDLKNMNPLKTNQIGEICVAGPVVTKRYYQNPTANEKAKFYLHDKLFHRMGDMGYLDEEGRLWFLGRKVHIVTNAKGEIYYPMGIEPLFNRETNIFERTALVQDKEGASLMIVPSFGVSFNQAHQHAKEIIQKRSLLIDHIYPIKAIKVDTRHNIKIDRTYYGQFIQGPKGDKLRWSV